MPASIIFNQPTTPAGVAGKARNDIVIGQPVTCTNSTVATTYLWTLLDAPIRSALTRGLTVTTASFSFTPDVKGTYLVSLRVNGSAFTTDNATSFVAVLSADLGWRYLGAGEERVDNTTKTGLGFPGNVNTRGWATDRDLQLEETEAVIVDVNDAVVVSPGLGTSNLVRIDLATGQIDPTLIPGGASGVASVGALTPLTSSGGVNPVILLNNGVSAGDVLTWTGLVWAGAAPSGGSGITKLIGDVTGIGPGITTASVEKIRGRTVDTTAPTGGQVYAWDAGTSKWVATTLASGGNTGFTAKYLVGNFSNGDTAATFTSNGFKYYKDTGDGAGIALALSDAASVPGEVYIRPGTYTTTATLTVPANTIVRGAGPATIIQSAYDAIKGPLVTLNNKAELHSLTLIHNDPGAIGTKYGVVHLAGSLVDDVEAYCTDINVTTMPVAGPTNSTLVGGFYAAGASGSGFKVKLTCDHCSVTYGGNTATTYDASLCGFRGVNAVMTLKDCYATATVASYPAARCVSLESSAVNPRQASLTITGGRYIAPLTAIIWARTAGFAEVYPVVITGAEIYACSDSSTSVDAGIYIYSDCRALINNCHISSNYGTGCVALVPAAGRDAYNTGSLTGCTLLSSNSRAWDSQSAGYHVITGNTYKNAVANVSSGNDEVAHNLLLP